MQPKGNLVDFESVDRGAARQALAAEFHADAEAQAPLRDERAEGSAVSLSATANVWLESLPPAQRPLALASHYPRIANRVAELWDDPRAAISALDELLIDKRCDRAGFPPEVLVELLHLQDFCMGRMPPRNPFLPNDPWVSRDEGGRSGLPKRT